MTYSYRYSDEIDLHVQGHISREAAFRQMKTAKVILERLQYLPGIILADEVGMGKTFVALAVATSIALGDRKRRPVVVMVPPALREKWPNDFRLFRDKCLRDQASRSMTYASADNAVAFLKLLDDQPTRRTSIIFLTHGAMSPKRKLDDGWVKLAVIQRALYGRHHTEDLKRNLGRYLGDLLRMKWVTRKNEDIWRILLDKPPSRWLSILEKYGLEPKDRDDPVPESVLEALAGMDLRGLYRALRENIPQKKSKHYEKRIKKARWVLDEHITALWEQCIRKLNLRLPLLVLDEAHHLKNPYTQLASLFHLPEARDDAEEFCRGPLAGAFERMLFLTQL